MRLTLQALSGLILLSLASTTMLARSSMVSDDQEIEIMFYNTLNLFDSQHDEGKNDWTYLPKGYPGKAEYCKTLSNVYYRKDCENSNWTPKTVALKVGQLARVVSHGKSLPDLLGLCEVENKNVVGKLAKKLGYRFFTVTDSPDRRGIDVALLYRQSDKLKLVRTEQHVMNADALARPTRNVLEVEFRVGRHSLIVFTNHWPSQAAPSRVRMSVAQQVASIIDKRVKKNPDTHIVLMGDFNVVDSDHPHPFKALITASTWKNSLTDLFRLSKSGGQNRSMPLGSYFYPRKMSWDRLDRFFITDNLFDERGLEAIPETFRIYAPSFITKDFEYTNSSDHHFGTVVKGSPWRANILATTPHTAGFSDHFPIVMKLKVD